MLDGPRLAMVVGKLGTVWFQLRSYVRPFVVRSGLDRWPRWGYAESGFPKQERDVLSTNGFPRVVPILGSTDRHLLLLVLASARYRGWGPGLRPPSVCR